MADLDALPALPVVAWRHRWKAEPSEPVDINPWHASLVRPENLKRLLDVDPLVSASAVAQALAERDALAAQVAGLRAATLEEVALVCESIKEAKNELGARTKNHYGPVVATGALMCAQAIRALGGAQTKGAT